LKTKSAAAINTFAQGKTTMRIIRASQHKTIPWKNGGGTATAIIEHPPGAGFDSFQWRVSGAHVGRDGPFSIFPHIDRTMFILKGEAMHLHGLGPEPVVLTRRSGPFRFSGDVPVTASLADGPIDDLNIMTDRRLFRHAAERRGSGTYDLQASGTLLVYAEAGQLTVRSGDQLATLEAHDCAIGEANMHLVVEADSMAIAMTFSPLGEKTSG
jgi:uncharacterized protein